MVVVSRSVLVSRSVRVGGEGGSKPQRKRHQGCNHPCRPCLAHTQHAGFLAGSWRGTCYSVLRRLLNPFVQTSRPTAAIPLRSLPCYKSAIARDLGSKAH